jgi:uncharacterized protein with PQ loop repeat
MSSLVSIQSIGYLGAAIGVLMVIPQIRRTLRNRARLGVSPLTWALLALSSFTWLLYGIRAGEPPQIPGNVLTVTGSSIVVLLVPSAVRTRARAAALAGLGSALVGLAVVAPVAAIGFVAFGIGLVSALPQLISSMRARTGEISAVSVPAWLLLGASQVSWLIYAIALHDVVVTISASFILASSLLLVGCELWRRSAKSVVEAFGERGLENVEACV